ncbi:probable iron-sulfur protein (2Fe-2S) [Haloquadratum walsbyi C23]|jgi:nitrite reductase/ring-hydroxylating ferredoxin subunit|uniref:Probable iron-sulfur protein (2Fe-2S) n=2 Tax=Haloquadratum walsbyi TaxID=293091 RepID=G0LHK0_HALWC|nr:probable iron-sulfur protein (2Fe-2S) [Haloquadratum walsbyi C23]
MSYIQQMNDSCRIASSEDVSKDETLVFTASAGFDTTEGILTRLSDDTIVAYTNYCPHWRDVRLDSGSGALVRDETVVCQKHGATFEKSTGHCDFGPCEGAVLDTFDITVTDGTVYLTDNEWEEATQGVSEDRDLSSGTQIGF